MKWLKRYDKLLLLLLILALSTMLRLAFLHEPFDRDEGQYATIANNILHGGLPYRDAVEIKPPGAFYLYALGIGLFGATPEALRIFAALYSLLTVIAVYGVARRLASEKAGLFAALLYGVYATFPLIQGSGCNTEVFLVLPMTAGVWFLLGARETEKRSWCIWAGLCGAFALMIKPQALPLVALEFLLIPFLIPRAGRKSESAMDLAAFFTPIVACACATFGYFFLRGGFDDLLYWTVQFPHRYREPGVDLQRILAVLQHLFSSLLVPVLVGISSALWLALRRRNLIGVLPLLMIGAVSIGIILPGKYYPHYFLMAVPFLAIPAGIGLANLTQMSRTAQGVAVVALVGSVVFSVWDNYRYYLVLDPEQVSTEKYHTSAFVESVTVAKYLRERTRPDDYIFQWGLEPELYFLADRRCPNPYLVSILPGWSRDPQGSVAEVVQSLVTRKPAYVVFQREWADFEGVDQVYDYLQRNYVAETTIGYADIYRCRNK